MTDDRFHFWLPKTNISNETFEPSGGGISFKRANMKAHGRRIARTYRQTIERIKSKNDFDSVENLFLQIKTPTSFPIKHAKQGFEKANIDLVSYSLDNAFTATAKIHKSNIASIQSRLKNYAEIKNNPGKSYFSSLEYLTEVPLEDKIDKFNFKEGNTYNCIISFFSILSRREVKKVSTKIIDYLKSYDIRDFREIDLVDDSTLLSATLRYEQILEIGTQFLSVSTITLDSAALITESRKANAFPASIEVGPLATDETVCLLDTGVSTATPHMAGLIEEKHEYLPPSAVGPELTHGTLVGSRIVFGDNIERQIALGKFQPICKIVDVQVFGKNADGEIAPPLETDLVQILNTLVPKLASKTKVFNLSFGFAVDYRVLPITKLGQFLDALTNLYGVTFVTTSGNYDGPLGNYPYHFKHPNAVITAPAESILSITVGSFAASGDDTCLTNINSLSPFSRIGPGYNNTVKPEVVESGGNLLKSLIQSPRHSVYGLHADGYYMAFDIGTSFAAPIVCGYLAKLISFYNRDDPNFLKSLLIHFAEDVSTPSIGIPPLFMRGFGRPNLNSMFNAKTNALTILHQGRLRINQYQWLAFHIPSCLDSSLNAEFEIGITLVYNPPVNKDNLKEYSKARMNCSIYKSTDTGLKKVSAINDDEKVSAAWNPIIRFSNAFKRSYSTGEWRLKLRLYTRDITDDHFMQNYSIVIEILDRSGNQKVYDSFIKEYGHLYLKASNKEVA